MLEVWNCTFLWKIYFSSLNLWILGENMQGTVGWWSDNWLPIFEMDTSYWPTMKLPSSLFAFSRHSIYDIDSSSPGSDSNSPITSCLSLLILSLYPTYTRCNTSNLIVIFKVFNVEKLLLDKWISSWGINLSCPILSFFNLHLRWYLYYNLKAIIL